LDLLREGNRREDIAQAEAAVAERRAALANAQGDVDRLESLRGTGAVADRRIEDAVNQRNEAAARLRSAQQALAEQRAGTRRQEIAQAASNVDRANATADRIRIRVADTVLRAPSDGTILTRAIERGANISSGATAFTEALARPVWARVFVDAPNLGLVAPGTIVNITTDAAPGKVYKGRVGYVSPTAEFTPKSVETEALRTDLVYRARVIVLDPDSRLRQGMPITVRLASGARAVED
jgi:HlyD family secretion protein